MFQGNEQTELDLKFFRIWVKASQAVMNNVRRDIESKGISPENFMILELLYNKGPHPIQQISEIFSIPTGSITYVVDKLEKNEFVNRIPSPTDRRASLIVLTEKGKDLFDNIFPSHVETISQNLSFITDDEKLIMIQLLKKIGIGAADIKINK
ncbi:MarR family winged helix-turn-helix transcriptional regulator [Gottfriedia solisilvae]|uniref:MarR family transcriptional regulator n=1 Tax=Gottfriedia solisilvae TaxID=1516104 RepID=A0A8J3F1Z3_9BACI|nr:MarR family transcriptional regulator [Gottfriedia solisilvae]GGI17857.1 MarR family transcriptional regulator [Gottfriedia solisilvae]